jgi:putative transposase
MQVYRKGSLIIHDIKYHVVWKTKYRKLVLSGLVAERGREIIRQVCNEEEVRIINSHLPKDHTPIGECPFDIERKQTGPVGKGS